VLDGAAGVPSSLVALEQPAAIAAIETDAAVAAATRWRGRVM
jgi:hypothetical protein